MNKVEYPVNEIFYSLQGEGFHTGTPSVFIRFAGCNLKCAFCDTDFTKGRLMNIEEIAENISRYPAKRVVLTGGEPTLHNLVPLCQFLHDKDYLVHIETNGTNPVVDIIDWVTCSPKKVADDEGHLKYRIDTSLFERTDELKIVYTDSDDLENFAGLFLTPNKFLQPCSMDNTVEVIDYILNNPRWRLSLQTHKYIDIP